MNTIGYEEALDDSSFAEDEQIIHRKFKQDNMPILAKAINYAINHYIYLVTALYVRPTMKVPKKIVILAIVS